MPRVYGIIPWTPDEYPLCVDRVRYVGDGVAAVAAIDEDTAIRALALIRVEYEELPAFLDPHAALAADGSSPYVHDAKKDGWNGNITKRVHLEFGEVDGLMDASDVLVEDNYFFEGTTHTPQSNPTARSVFGKQAGAFRTRTAPPRASSRCGHRPRCPTICIESCRRFWASIRHTSGCSSRWSGARLVGRVSRSTLSSASRSCRW